MSDDTERERGVWPFVNLPNGWVWAQFDQVFTNLTSSDKKLSQDKYERSGKYPVIDQGQQNVSGYSNDVSLVYSGPLPVIVFGDHTLCVKLVQEPFVQGADGVKILHCTEAMNTEFVYWAMRLVSIPNHGYSRHYKFLRATRFPVAPLAEQSRIVAALDDLFAHSRRAKEALAAVPTLLERYRQAVLAAAFRGELTAEWREKHPDAEPASELLKRIRAERRRRWEEVELSRLEAKGKTLTHKKRKEHYPAMDNSDTSTDYSRIDPLPATWARASVGEISECLDYLRRPVNREERKANNGVFPYYGANGQVGTIGDYIFDEELVLVTEDETFYGRTKPIAYRVSGKCWVNNHAHVLRANNPLSSDSLCYMLMHYPVEPWLSGSTGRAKLTQGALNALPLAIALCGWLCVAVVAPTPRCHAPSPPFQGRGLGRPTTLLKTLRNHGLRCGSTTRPTSSKPSPLERGGGRVATRSGGHNRHAQPTAQRNIPPLAELAVIEQRIRTACNVIGNLKIALDSDLKRIIELDKDIL